MEKNIYWKIQQVKGKFLERNVKKSGKNKFANYSYYELADIIPNIIYLCNEQGLFTKFTFTKEEARLEIRNVEKPDEFEFYTSPMEELELKGANRIQALGGVETYQRRYLLMAAFDIIENDMFDGVVHEEVVDYKRLLKDKVEKAGIDFKEYAVENKLSSKTTQEEAKELLNNLNV
jgi:hypothetical protein